MYGAGDAIRTRDIYLGKVVLYQLSYSRDKKNPRADRLFRDAAIRVSLARLRFTTQFGMAWGGSTALWARGCLGLGDCCKNSARR
jgi:hypothetical protein